MDAINHPADTRQPRNSNYAGTSRAKVKEPLDCIHKDAVLWSSGVFECVQQLENLIGARKIAQRLLLTALVETWA